MQHEIIQIQQTLFNLNLFFSLHTLKSLFIVRWSSLYFVKIYSTELLEGLQKFRFFEPLNSIERAEIFHEQRWNRWCVLIFFHMKIYYFEHSSCVGEFNPLPNSFCTKNRSLIISPHNFPFPSFYFSSTLCN